MEEELLGISHFRVLRTVEMLYSDGWNDTHVMPYQNVKIDKKATNGLSLLWTQPPANHKEFKCENQITVPKKLFVV